MAGDQSKPIEIDSGTVPEWWEMSSDLAHFDFEELHDPKLEADVKQWELQCLKEQNYRYAVNDIINFDSSGIGGSCAS